MKLPATEQQIADKALEAARGGGGRCARSAIAG
jgi:hypothetical protein